MPNTVVWGGTYGAETYGQDPYGSRAFDSTAPSISNLSPANGAEGVLITDPITFQVYSPSALDPWSLSVTVDSVTLIAAGDFIPGNGGSIVFNGQTCTVNISTHTTWPSGSNPISIAITDLSGNLSTFNSTFIVETSNVVGVSDSVSVTDALSAQAELLLAASDTLGLSDAITTLHQVGYLAVSDMLGLTDSLFTHQATHPTLPTESMGVSDFQANHEHFMLGVTDSAPLTDSLTENPAYKANVADAVGLSDAVVYHYSANPHPSETVGLSETLTARHQAFEGLSETPVTVSDLQANIYGAHPSVSDTVPVTDQARPNTFTGIPVADSLSLSDLAGTRWAAKVPATDTVSIVDAVSTGEREPLFLADTVAVSDVVTVSHQASTYLVDDLGVMDQVNFAIPALASNTTLTIEFSNNLRIDGIPNLDTYTLNALGGAFPVQLLSVEPMVRVLAMGSNASIVAVNPFYEITIPTVDFTTLRAGYLFISSPTNQNMYLRIVAVVSPTTVQVDLPLLPDPLNGSILWEAISGVTGLVFQTTKFTNDGGYEFIASGLMTVSGLPFNFDVTCIAESPLPRVVSATSLPNSQILVTFSDPMLVDEDLQDPEEYILTGSGTPSVATVSTVSPTQVSILPQNLGSGSYSLTVGTHTPHDLAGNPIDPLYNTVIFMPSVPLNSMSIFTDFGPIARPPLTLQEGTGLSFLSPTNVTVTGGSFGPNLVGLYLTIVGTSNNDGTYKILAIPANNQLMLMASFTLPDGNQLTASWSVFDPRDGEIADDPAHVTVRINGVPTRPTAVVGLLGQIVMATAPTPTDDVQVDYSWVRNPTVELRRLNSTEFRLNNWNQDSNRLHDSSGHKYRFNNVLPVPTNFTTPPNLQTGSQGAIVPFQPSQFYLPDGNLLTDFAGLNLAITAGLNSGVYDIVSVIDSHLIVIAGTLNLVDPLSGHIPWTVGDTSDLQAQLPQPLLRDLKYRAYERAYTAVLNDPNSLLLNSPVFSIAFPLLQRTLVSSFVSYEPTGLPENDPVAPWNRVGVGNVSILADELIVTPVPVAPGNYIYWNQTIDLTFPYVFATTWQNRITSTPTTQGVFTGVAFGYSDNKRAVIVGYLLSGTTAMIGFLKQGSGNDPSLITAWTGGIDSNGNPTGAPLAVDWTVDHSYRTYQDPSGNISLYLDGEIVANMQVMESQLPYLEELTTPFSTLQGVYFGSLGQTTVSTSVWDYTRYTILPLNPLQTAPSIFVSYEGNVTPEVSSNPWTPIGYHGTETIINHADLLLDSTSAVSSSTTLIGGDFRGYSRLEPLLATDANIFLDIDMSVRTWTHGISPNAVTAMVDDGDRLIQLSFLADVAAPKFSYGGDTLPTASIPAWEEITTGSPTAVMLGRTLQVTNPTSSDGLIFIIDDTQVVAGPSRVLGMNDYILEARMLPLSYTADPITGFVGAVAQTYDSTKTLGFYLADNGSRFVVVFGLDAFGVVHIVATLPFEWKDGNPHTYRLVYANVAGLVSIFFDGVYVTTENYSAFPTPTANPAGYVSFGSSIPGSVAVSQVNWIYCNAWRVGSATRHYVGIWKGNNPNAFTGYHIPTKVTGQNALIVGNALADINMNFLTAGVAEGDILIVDNGPNQGSYVVSSAPTVNTLTINVMWPQQPGRVSYRVLQETDWTQQHRYRIALDPLGTEVSVLLDANQTPLFIVDYNNINLPPSVVGLPRLVAGTVPSIMWGAMDPMNLSQTCWTYVRYGVTRSPTELRIVPQHQVLNQRNVIASPEHLTTNIPHTDTDYWSSSTGIPPQTIPDLLQNPGMVAFTLLNDDTPLVPSTETYEVRRPTPRRVFSGGLNNQANPLNNNSFKLNETDTRIQLVVPKDVLYNQLMVIEHDTGTPGLIAPFTDQEAPLCYGPLFYQNTVCLTYDAETLPESDPTAITPWVFEAGNPTHVNRSVFEGVLTYGTDSTGTQSIYRNATPLTDSISLGLQVKFKLKLLQDGSGGLSDSQVRFGFSAFGMTLALAFVSAPTGLRYVLCYDLASDTIVGGVPFDFYDGNQHTYRICREPDKPQLRIFIDS